MTINLKYALNTERAQIRRVAEHWRAQYPAGSPKSKVCVIDPDAAYAKLKALDVETATDNDVRIIIGNTSWVRPLECNQCGVKTWRTITLGESHGYESATASLCLACLREAVAALEAAE